jgi:hypothetical protein
MAVLIPVLSLVLLGIVVPAAHSLIPCITSNIVAALGCWVIWVRVIKDY